MSKQLVSVNPFDQQEIARYDTDSPQAIETKLRQAAKAFGEWKILAPQERAAYIRTLAGHLLRNKQYMAQIATDEMGKPISQAVAEVEKCAASLKYYADNGPQMLAPEVVNTEAGKAFVTYQPLGSVLAIMPWNFPYWQAYRALAPILTGGNAMLLKHASNVTGCALAMEKIAQEAGLPQGLFQVLLVSSADTEAIMADSRIHAVTFTGSTVAGRKVAALAGAHLKKQVLELGGSDAYVVLADADIELAAATCVQSRMTNTGQSCIAAKRFVVVEAIADEFTKMVVEKMKALTWGNPNVEGMQAGPMARMDLRNELHQQVQDSVAKGAVILCGGQLPEGLGAFYPPTVLANVKKGMPAYDEELFGPVAAVIAAKDEAEAIAIANDTEFGLGGALFTKDMAKAEAVATTMLEAGSIFVNDFVKSDARLPFGGIKQSGYGRELSYFGLREFVNVKTVSMQW
ncbi:MAG: NAD-dependent succinate-semialdehyde dehydrogenase [Edaphocola sp.]